MSEKSPPVQPDLLADAIESFDRGDIDGCLDRIHALKLRSTDAVPADAHYFEALCHRRSGNLARAATIMADAVEAAPEEADYLLELGLILIESGRTQEGLDRLRDAVHASDHAPEFRHELYLQNALALYSEGFLEASVLSLRKALKFAEDVDTYRVLTQFLIEWGKADEALDVISQGLEKFPRDARLHHMAGLALSVSRRPYEAAQEFVRAYELNPADPEPVHSLALVFEAAGDVHRALETYERCLLMNLDDEARADVTQRVSRLKSKLAGG